MNARQYRTGRATGDTRAQPLIALGTDSCYPGKARGGRRDANDTWVVRQVSHERFQPVSSVDCDKADVNSPAAVTVALWSFQNQPNRLLPQTSH